MAVIIAGGTFLGDYLDTKHTSKIPAYTIFFSLFSIFLALYYVVKIIINHNAKK